MVPRPARSVVLILTGPRRSLRAGACVASPRPGNARPRAVPGAALGATAGRPRAARRPGRRVVALREVEGMPHPAHTPATATLVPGPPRDLPARRGHALAFKVWRAVRSRSSATAGGDPGCRRRCRHSAPPLPAERRPVDLAQPDRAGARGRPSTRPAAGLPSSAHERPCGSPPGRSTGRRGHHPGASWRPVEGEHFGVNADAVCLGGLCSAVRHGRDDEWCCCVLGRDGRRDAFLLPRGPS